MAVLTRAALRGATKTDMNRKAEEGIKDQMNKEGKRRRGEKKHWHRRINYCSAAKGH